MNDVYSSSETRAHMSREDIKNEVENLKLLNSA